MILRSPRVATGQSSIPVTVPPPIGGLNGRDPRAAMDVKDAYLLDNAFPGTASVDSRNGCRKWSSASLGGPVQSLEVYSGAAGDKMLAWAAGKIFDVSTEVPQQLAAGLLSNLVVTTMFSNAADTAQRLIITSGSDLPRAYDGAALTVLNMTGMQGSASTLNSCFAFKGRLYFGQRDKLGFYTLPPGQIQGALSYFDLGQVSRLGGYLVAMASFSESTNGSSPADYIVFITNKGEMIVYAGYDPTNAATWELVGRYYSAAPIGRRCMLNYNSDLVILTLEGALPFSEIRRSGDAKSQGVGGADYVALTSKLGNFLSAFNRNADVPGWQGLQYSGSGGWLILNVPATGSLSGAYYHYVMNTVTRAWCRFTNWNGMCFCVYNKRLYFGRFDGYVMLGDDGKSDDGADIRLDIKQAYNYFDDGQGMAFLQKHFQWASLLVSCDSEPPLSGKFNVDYFEEQPDYINTLSATDTAIWDVAAWDGGMWGSEDRTQRFMITLNKGGTVGSLWLRAALRGSTLRWYATQYVMQQTKGLLL